MADCSLPDKFCCCYTLKGGGKFIAGLCLATSIISCICLTIYLTADMNEIAREIAASDENAENLKEDASTARICAGIVLILSLLLLVSSALLLRGISNKSKQLFVPFFATVGLTIFFLFIISIIQFNAGGLFAVLTFIVVLIYLLLCILSLYKVIDASECNQQTDIHLNQNFAP